MAAMDFPASPTVGQIYTQAGSPVFVWDGTVWKPAGLQNGVPTAGLRNAVINGNFDVWQRTVPGAFTNTTAFTADRWFLQAIGSTVTPSFQNETPGSIPGPMEPRWFHGTVVASVAGASNYAYLGTRLEGVRTLAGQQVTLSFYAWGAVAQPMSVETWQNFGATGSPSAAVSTPVGKINLTTAVQKYSLTFTIPSILGKTIGTDGSDYIELRFWLDAGSAFNTQASSLGQRSGTFYHSGVQLEAGPVATPFERRPVGLELAMCQRYYEAGRVYMGFACPAAGGYAQNHYAPFRTYKRAAPTMTRSFTAGVNVSAYTPIGADPNGDSVQLVGTGQLNVTATWDWTASAEI